ncbi:P-loop containing nucleoside triphosphate hydrolase protein, partial [Chiua virens]
MFESFVHCTATHLGHEFTSFPTTHKPIFDALLDIRHLREACEQMSRTRSIPLESRDISISISSREHAGVTSTDSGEAAVYFDYVLLRSGDTPASFFDTFLEQTSTLAFALYASLSYTCRTTVVLFRMLSRAVALAKRPHIIVATPGRLNDHLQSTKGFSLRHLKFLVMDEADRLLDMDFGADIDQILKVIPKERTTYLFSATMTTKVAKLQRASLSNPVRVEVSSKYQTVSTLLQYYLFVPLIHKDVHLTYLANELASNSVIVFTRTVHDAQRLSIILRTLGFPAVPLHGQLSQSQRLGALNKFKTGGRQVLVATDVASRGLDIPSVDVVINFDIPTHSKDYIHRVGRTARAGRAGKSITIVTQYDVELLQRIEKVIGKKLELLPTSKEEVMLLKERVNEAGRLAVNELKEKARSNGGKKRRRDEGGGRNTRDERDRDDDVVEAGLPKTKKHKGRR